jgi:uncharacterized membrane protein
MDLEFNPVWPYRELVVFLAVLLVGGGFIAWKTAERCSITVRLWVTSARLLGLAGIGLLALNPGKWVTQREDTECEWVVLADRSASMAVADLHGRPRWETAVRLAEVAAAEASRQGTTARIVPFSADAESSASNPAALAALAPDGPTTDLERAGEAALAATAPSRRVAGIVVLSDGRQIDRTRPQRFALRASAHDAPILAVPLAGDVARRDLSIKVGRRQLIGFSNQEVRIQTEIVSEGMGAVSPVVELLDGEGRVLSSKRVSFLEDGRASLTFAVTPETPGYAAYSVRVQPGEGERNERNNTAAFGILTLESKSRVMVAEGTPFWDSKFLVQLLREQPHLEVVSTYRLSADRFFRVETTAKTADVAPSTFPDKAEDLARLDIIVFGKGAEYFMTPDRVRLLQDWVRDQGGTVIFARGKPYHGDFPALAQIEPVTWGPELDASFAFRPTASGRDAGLFTDELSDPLNSIWSSLPVLEGANDTARIKPFTQILVEGVLSGGDRERAFPGVFAGRFGKGMVVVVNADGLWRWDFFPPVTGAENMYDAFWSQLMQWAATYAEFLPGQDFAIRLSETSVTSGTPVRAVVSRRGGDDPEAELVLRLRPAESPGDAPPLQELVAARDPSEPGRWNAVLSVTRPGLYRVEIGDARKPGWKGPGASLEIPTPPSENDNLSADRPFLERLANESAGRMVAPEELAQAMAALVPASRTTTLARPEWEPWWHQGWILCMIIACFAVEWIARRRSGLL